MNATNPRYKLLGCKHDALQDLAGFRLTGFKSIVIISNRYSVIAAHTVIGQFCTTVTAVFSI